MYKLLRNLLGEDLGPLSVKELQNLEKQLEGALAMARQRKVHACMCSTSIYKLSFIIIILLL